MVAKRKRRASPSAEGLDPGVRLNRVRLGHAALAWSWIGTEAIELSDITKDHLLATCGFSTHNGHPFCANKYIPGPSHDSLAQGTKAAAGELEDDVIIISDDEDTCNKKLCKSNPNCLNYLGQGAWEDADESQEKFLEALDLGHNPLLESRDPNLPVGLRNLGATCYANAFIQVWFQDLAFRTGVYRCQPVQDMEQTFEESPIFQLQVTFTALQESAQNVFNPVKLAESLKLSTTEQQDAQEFSKLFMSHLDLEFQKQPAPNMKSLLSGQFQGKQVYGTICQACQYRSETLTDFLELEINFQHDSTLEDRIEALLQPETLSGDNKYLCARCNALRDATRYTELRELPPVLHFSLLRFVYDVNSMERKKSKHAISFPICLDMDRFVGSAAQRQMPASQRDNRNVYELRGVLLHKGPSAYHGHYEAQVFDVMRQAWFQFDDEKVSGIKVPSLGEGRRERVIAPQDVDNQDQTSSSHRKRLKSDGKIASSIRSPQSMGPTTISSRDAYMLIYARKGANAPACSPVSTHGSKSLTVPEPPPRALKVIKELNSVHNIACEVYVEREKQAKMSFVEARRKVMDIYRSWNVSQGNEPSVVVSGDALRTWLSIQNIAKALKQRQEHDYRSTYLDPHFDSDVSSVVVIPSDIKCIHGFVDPQKANGFKRITQDAYGRLMTDTNCRFTPSLSPDDVCEICVKEHFVEKLYQIQHPQNVQEFDVFYDVEVEIGYWISKPWLKDWRLMKPKMHTPGQADPAPDSEEFRHHVRCEHGNLALSVMNRRRIPTRAFDVLKNLFPSWQPMSTDAEPCPVCDCLINMSRSEKLELRKKAEVEKARLKNMHEYALNGDTALLEDVPCAIIPTQFIRSWRQWLVRPTEAMRPERADNSPFLCEHRGLVFDLNNVLDLDSSVTVITRSDWNSVEELYSAGPLIALENRSVECGDGKLRKFVPDIPICESCRHKRRFEYEVAEINIRILPPESDPKDGQLVRTWFTPIGASSSIRQSKRLRRVRMHGERRKLTITKLMTVKDIKIALQQELGISPICQKLFYNGVELDDSSATVEKLGILANDLLDLREENELEERLDSDVEVTHAKGPRREGSGFDGTLLMGALPRGESSDPVACDLSSPTPDIKTCPACTYHNPSGMQACQICEHLL